MTSRTYIDQLTYRIIGCAITVHKELGPGLLESVYHKCLIRELQLNGLEYQTQIWLPLHYRGIDLENELRVDVVVEDLIVVEIKAIDTIHPIHKAQLLTYMRLLNKPKGVLINFNCLNIFKEGQCTLVNKMYASLPDGENQHIGTVGT